MDKKIRYQKLKIKEILEDIRENDLKSFIRQYAKKDMSFEIIFKSHFLSRIQLGDEGNKYKLILEELIKPKSSHNSKITPGKKKTITIILGDFIQQMNDCLTTDYYTEAFPLVKESLEKIAYLQHRFEVKDISLEKFRIQFLEGADLILKADLAPLFRNKVEKELISIIEKSYYFPENENLIAILNENNVLIEEDKKRIIEDLHEKSKTAIDQASLLSTIIQLSYPFPELAENVIVNIDHQKIFVALKKLINQGKLRYLDFFFDDKNGNYKYQKEALLSFKYLATKDYKKLAKSLNKIDLPNLDHSVFEELIDSLDTEFLKKEIENIESWISGLSFSHQCKLYLKAEKYDLLLHQLTEKKDADWLKVYDMKLIENGYKKEVNKLYLDVVDKYFNNHIGYRSTEFMDRVRFHLTSISQFDIINNLTLYVSKNFGHRKTINSKY